MGYLALGPAGAAVFFLPVGMLWLGVKQYTARTHSDAEELQHANLALARNEERFRSLVQNAPGLIAVLNPDGSLQYLSPTEVLTAAEPHDGNSSDFAALVHPDDRPRLQEAIEGVVDNRADDAPIELKIVSAGGDWRDYEVAIANLIDNASVRGIVNQRARHHRAYRAREPAPLRGVPRPPHGAAEPCAVHGPAAHRAKNGEQVRSSPAAGEKRSSCTSLHPPPTVRARRHRASRCRAARETAARAPRCGALVGPVGFEPTRDGLKVRCSGR